MNRPVDEPWVLLARVIRPQGRKGEVLAEILTDFPERFSERRRLFLRAMNTTASPREIELASHWLHKGRIVFKFHGVDSINDAEPLRGLDVLIPREERATLENGSIYIADIVGAAMHDRGTGQHVGTIEDIDRESASTPLFVVRATGGEELLIPFANAYEPSFDPEQRRLEITLPPGLLEINAPLTESERRELEEARHAEDEGNETLSSSAAPENKKGRGKASRGTAR